jgi:hypothetical protein
MTTKEKIMDDIDNLDKDELEAFHELVKQFLQTRQQKPAEKPLPDAWSEFFRIGDLLGALDRPQTESMTSAVTSTRR